MNENPKSPRLRPRGPKTERGIVPHNPGLYDLVTGLAAGCPPHRNSEPPPSSPSRGWHERGYLPHRDDSRLIQFITFRLADSLPAIRRAEWESILAIESAPQRKRKLEFYLDLGRGLSHLQAAPLARMVESAFLHFNGTRYRLHAWVIMPNHVHVMMEPMGYSIGAIVASWKSWTSRRANRMLGQTGPFWSRDYWDTWIRDSSHSDRVRKYIESNPVRAGLARTASDWTWSSARHRDAFGRLPWHKSGEP